MSVQVVSLSFVVRGLRLIACNSPVYTVSMVASLNARDDLRNHMAEAAGITTIPSMASLRGDGNLTVMEMKNSRKRALRL